MLWGLLHLHQCGYMSGHFFSFYFSALNLIHQVRQKVFSRVLFRKTSVPFELFISTAGAKLAYLDTLSLVYPECLSRTETVNGNSHLAMVGTSGNRRRLSAIVMKNKWSNMSSCQK